MTLFWWELKKMLRRRMTRLLLVLCLAFAAVGPLTLGFANLGFGTDVEAPTWEARACIVQATADAGAWQGPLTPAVLKAARADCRAVVESQGTVDGQAAFVQGNILYTAAEVFTDSGCISWENWPAKMTALEDGALDRFYDLWQENARRQIEAAPADQQALLTALRDRVALPFTYDWVAGHKAVLSALGNVMYLVGLLLCVGVVPLFCSELRTGVFPVSHCARCGRGKLTAAKLAAALSAAFAGEFPALAALVGVLVLLRALSGLLPAGGSLAFLARAVPFQTTLADFTGNALVTLPCGTVLPAGLYPLAVLPLWLVALLPLAARGYLRRRM